MNGLSLSKISTFFTMMFGLVMKSKYWDGLLMYSVSDIFSLWANFPQRQLSIILAKTLLPGFFQYCLDQDEHLLTPYSHE